MSTLTQSRFYSPSLNGAVFDGPIRIYFSQHQESLALKIYFRLQQEFKHLYARARTNEAGGRSNVFIMLYPSVEIFNNSFGSDSADILLDQEVIVERLGENYILGVKGLLANEAAYDQIYKHLEDIVQSWETLEQHMAPAAPLL